ncbi:MAG: hypothetical protein ACREEM_01625, partial [Blastocatellia bacterium]
MAILPSFKLTMTTWLFSCSVTATWFAALTSDLDPGVTGYLIAVAVDAATGCPINFNALIGDAYVKLDSGHAANLIAETFPMVPGSPSPCAAGSGFATLRFDGANYDTAPRTLALSNIPSRGSGNDTLLALNRFGGDLRTAVAPLGEFSGLLFDDLGQAFGFSTAAASCQFVSSLSNDFPRGFEDAIPTGRQGWMKMWLTDDVALLGAAINFNGTAGSTSFNHGRNLHKLTFTQSATMMIPILPYSGFQMRVTAQRRGRPVCLPRWGPTALILS